MTSALSVVMPAHNEANSIGPAIDRLREILDAGIREYEIIVVSDGSTDDTAAVARRHSAPSVRVLEYQRNEGKGHALTAGSLLARGRWIAWLDADLDLDPAPLLQMVDQAERSDLDAVIGSKRHPGSSVDYPSGRRLGSTAYQGFVRLLFGLNTRDTQVGMKVFRRDVLNAVLPRVLVKRYAFDLEVLALAHHLGFQRIQEAPIRLEYQFSGSGMNSRAVARALWDTCAVFYRLRIIRYYDRAGRMQAAVPTGANWTDRALEDEPPPE